jgi:hypothetical protein
LSFIKVSLTLINILGVLHSTTMRVICHPQVDLVHGGGYSCPLLFYFLIFFVFLTFYSSRVILGTSSPKKSRACGVIYHQGRRKRLKDRRTYQRLKLWRGLIVTFLKIRAKSKMGPTLEGIKLIFFKKKYLEYKSSFTFFLLFGVDCVELSYLTHEKGFRS